MGYTNPVHEHVETILKHEQEFLARRSYAERLGDATAAIVGSLSFVACQLLFVAGWVVVNSTHVTAIRHFDPAPFSLLSGCLTLEGILLASFILMRQARLGRRSDEREHLMLQILLLTEKEITAVIGINRQVAVRLGLGEVGANRDIEQLAKETSIDEVAKSIQENLSGGSNG
ncbi:putative membrane protein [Silvibacterium bohemicum]|uniref:Putative membrane protein n=1 Tax=Silvibacterium bohemicum TaxID=1577686 RepID=A0A841JUV4_9BACT|nr:DUF1003 domain-containing protein [Silvibacterium bohemicum]MBB6145116.1 putative membrane protein [Silvibacterium bohemicum]